VRAAGVCLRPAGWSPLEYSEDPMPSLVGLEHGSGGDRWGRSDNRWGPIAAAEAT
jgi:hypothetical protein